MQDRIYNDDVNPNARALIVPQQEGGSEEDNYFGSIGDSVNKHVASLNDSDRQIWQDLIHTNNGLIFRTEPSTSTFDRDPMNLRGEDLGEWLKRWVTIPTKYDNKGNIIEKRKPTESEIQVLQEAVEIEQEHRMDSEDAYDHAETIPYSEYEKYPGMEKHIEMPRSPKDRLIFMGNTSQMFYDYFPTGHPDEAIINIALQKLDKSWDDITPKYANWFGSWIRAQPVKKYVSTVLSRLCNILVTTERAPIEVTQAALMAIDRVWQEEWHKAAKKKTDPIHAMLKKNQLVWRKEAKEGQTPFGKIKNFGQILWKNYKDDMKAHHWQLYRKIRNEHIPAVYLRGVDINRCNLDKLRELFKVDYSVETRCNFDLARDVWTNRPFASLEEVRTKGFINKETFVDNSKADEIMTGLEAAVKEAKEKKDVEIFAAFRTKMIDAQRDKSNGLMNWSPIWAYYHLLKNELDKSLEVSNVRQAA